MPIFYVYFPVLFLVFVSFIFVYIIDCFFELVFLFRNIYDTWRLVLIKISLRFLVN